MREFTADKMREIIKDSKARASTRDADMSDPKIYSFPQCWTSSSLGFPGGGASVITWAQTTVLTYDMNADVYFDDRFAYTTHVINISHAIQNQNLPSCHEICELNK